MSDDEPLDPLVAGLPPTLDYFSYLTLLEYQLKPNNISTLNNLLLSDDGTLAQEIGWELPRLILPLLHEAPDEAKRCLGIIARRGNPREVVVKVAEILETLGEDGGDAENEANSGAGEDDEDDLPTFSGEAERIHLGKMVLDGMPQSSSVNAPVQEEKSEPANDPTPLIFESLLNMLSIVHPRIKTQYPSRFLATSLIAALAAYRRIQVTDSTTSSCLTLLSKLSGKQRPALPPRISTANKSEISRSESAPLPDPEGTTDLLNSQSSPIETAIYKRLLQAEMLEVLDHYTSFIQSTESPTFSWTPRSREIFEPEKTVPGRPTEVQKWQSDEALSSRDSLMTRWVRLAADLDLDLAAALQEQLSELDDAEESEPGSPSEYPRSPSEIPLLPGALAIIHAASQFLQRNQTTASLSDEKLKIESDLQQLWLQQSTAHSKTGTPYPTAEADALLASLYISLHAENTTLATLPTERLTALLESLNAFSATHPDPTLRDSAHTVASAIFHSQSSTDQRLATAKQMLINLSNTTTDDAPTPASHPRAIITDWLKSEFLTFFNHTAPNTDKGINPTILEKDTILTSLLFPQNPPTTADDLAAQIPSTVASLNLFCVLRARAPQLGLENAEEMVQGLVGPMRMLAGHEEGQTWALEDAIGRAVDAL